MPKKERAKISLSLFFYFLETIFICRSLIRSDCISQISLNSCIRRLNADSVGANLHFFVWRFKMQVCLQFEHNISIPFSFVIFFLRLKEYLRNFIYLLNWACRLWFYFVVIAIIIAIIKNTIVTNSINNLIAFSIVSKHPPDCFVLADFTMILFAFGVSYLSINSVAS